LPKKYWQEVENDEQLIERDPTGMIREAVRTYAGSLDGSFVERYKKLYEQAKAQTANRYGPDLYKGYALADVRNDQSFLSPLPALRGNEWTAHVFRKPDLFAPSSSRLKSAIA
jgi:hypothetical protein